ncbi:MAG: hypothetical protein ACHQAY_20180 [Hyphomicrobiales bacterium]
MLSAATPAPAQLSEFCQFTGNPGPCLPYDQYQDAIGQELRITLVLRPQGGTTTEPPAVAAPGPLPRRLNTIREVFGALRACFSSVGIGESKQELAATVRFSFRRSGEILGEPHFTYVRPGLSADTKQAFEQAIGRTLIACAPLPFTDGLGGALAGRPISVRIVKPAAMPIRS